MRSCLCWTSVCGLCPWVSAASSACLVPSLHEGASGIVAVAVAASVCGGAVVLLLMLGVWLWPLGSRYLGRPDRTAQSFVPFPPDLASAIAAAGGLPGLSDRLYRTGDLVRSVGTAVPRAHHAPVAHRVWRRLPCPRHASQVPA